MSSIDPNTGKRPLLKVCAQAAPSIAVACWLRYWVENMHTATQQTVDTAPGGGTLGVDDPCAMVEVRMKQPYAGWGLGAEGGGEEERSCMCSNMHTPGQHIADMSPGGGTLGVDDPCDMVEVSLAIALGKGAQGGRGDARCMCSKAWWR
jgi:hypothetical protein